MRLSHSKLSCILTCPMTYYLRYKVGINLKVKKPALAIGSAVHWGIEHNTDDLTEYWKSEEGLRAFKLQDNYTREQVLCESMVYGYLKHKDELFDEILSYQGEKLTLLEEYHELELYSELESFTYKSPHNFMGIIDLLLLTNKGFIVIDYKTSSQTPDWDKYLDQIYRYIYLLKMNFPDVPIIKIGIVNLRKASIRQRKNENDFEFINRLKMEYELNDEDYITYHEYLPEDLNERLLSDYMKNLSKEADMAELIDESNNFYINYNEAVGVYGKSDYYDIFYHTPDAFLLYNISDNIYNKDFDTLESIRDCRPLDMLVIESKNVLNKYDTFKANIIAYYSVSNSTDKNEIFEHLKKSYICDDELLNIYWDTLEYEMKSMTDEELKKLIF